MHNIVGQVMHNGLEMLLSLSQHHTAGKQRVATAVFSQHHHDKMELHRLLICFNYHLQYLMHGT